YKGAWIQRLAKMVFDINLSAVVIRSSLIIHATIITYYFHGENSLMRGVTLMEIMIVMTIMMIIVGTGFSNLSHLQREARNERLSTQMVNLVQYANEVALVTHKTVGICIAKDDKCVQQGS